MKAYDIKQILTFTGVATPLTHFINIVIALLGVGALYIIMWYVISGVSMAVGSSSLWSFLSTILSVSMLVLPIWIIFASMVKRLRDAGWPTLAVLLVLVPLIGQLFFLLLFVLPSQGGSVRREDVVVDSTKTASGQHMSYDEFLRRQQSDNQ